MSYFIPLEPDSALEDVYYFHMLRLEPGGRLALPLPPMPMLTPPGGSWECGVPGTLCCWQGGALSWESKVGVRREGCEEG